MSFSDINRKLQRLHWIGECKPENQAYQAELKAKTGNRWQASWRRKIRVSKNGHPFRLTE